MAYLLMNTATIPHGGIFTYKVITEKDAARWLRDHGDAAHSFIGYQQTADRIRSLWHRPAMIPLNRAKCVMQPGDQALVVRLAYRIEDPKTKGQPQDEQWEYGLMEFHGVPIEKNITVTTRLHNSCCAEVLVMVPAPVPQPEKTGGAMSRRDTFRCTLVAILLLLDIGASVLVYRHYRHYRQKAPEPSPFAGPAYQIPDIKGVTCSPRGTVICPEDCNIFFAARQDGGCEAQIQGVKP